MGRYARHQRQQVPQRRILLVDDSAKGRSALGTRLHGVSHYVAAAKSGPRGAAKGYGGQAGPRDYGRGLEG